MRAAARGIGQGVVELGGNHSDGTLEILSARIVRTSGSQSNRGSWTCRGSGYASSTLASAANSKAWPPGLERHAGGSPHSAATASNRRPGCWSAETAWVASRRQQQTQFLAVNQRLAASAALGRGFRTAGPTPTAAARGRSIAAGQGKRCSGPREQLVAVAPQHFAAQTVDHPVAGASRTGPKPAFQPCSRCRPHVRVVMLDGNQRTPRRGQSSACRVEA